MRLLLPYSLDSSPLDVFERGMAHVGSLDDVDHLLGDVLGVVADALDRLGHPDGFQRSRNGARILHHVGDQLAQHRAEFVVDRRVFLQHLGRAAHVQAREGVERLAQHLHRDLGGMADRREALRGMRALLVDALGHARDLLGLVADALEVGDDLADRHDQAQVARRRLALDHDVVDGAVDRDLVAVDARVVFDHLRDERLVAGGEGLDRGEDLRLDQSAHLQHARARGVEVGLELLGNMLGHAHDGSLGEHRLASRTCR